MKLRRVDDKSALMLTINTILFGTGAVLVCMAWVNAIRSKGSYVELFDAVIGFEEPLLLITVAILLGGVFHSFTVLYPTLLKNRADKQKALHEVSDFKDQAYRDPLTGLFNRRYFDEIISAYVRVSFGLLVLDIDHFKRINDTYGHSAGDEVLREIAVCSQRLIRDNDVVARIGGEEFAILLAYVNEKQLSIVADRFRQHIASIEVSTDNGTVRPTTSIGAVLSSGHQSVEDMMKDADECLYKAKNTGRNRVISRLNFALGGQS